MQIDKGTVFASSSCQFDTAERIDESRRALERYLTGSSHSLQRLDLDCKLLSKRNDTSPFVFFHESGLNIHVICTVQFLVIWGT